MIEVVFVIVIVGILSGVIFNKMFFVINDAIKLRLTSQITNIRSSIFRYYSNHLVNNNPMYPKILDDANYSEEQKLFDGNDSFRLLLYPLLSKNQNGYWMKKGINLYSAKFQNQDILFEYNSTNGVFDCMGINQNKAKELCKQITN